MAKHSRQSELALRLGVSLYLLSIPNLGQDGDETLGVQPLPKAPSHREMSPIHCGTIADAGSSPKAGQDKDLA